MEETKARIAKGAKTGSFMERVLMDQANTGLDDEQIAYLGGILVRVLSSTLIQREMLTPVRWRRAQTRRHPLCFLLFWG